MAAGTNPQGDWDRIYAELRRLAGFFLRRRAPHDSLQPTALVNEAWLRLGNRSWRSRSHFLAVASSVMRSFLVDYARARLAQKRGEEQPHIAIEGPNEPAARAFDLVQVLAVHEALDRLARTDQRKARIVEMRFFGGMDFDEIAEALGVAPITVKRDWQLSRAWLYASLTA